MVEKRPDERMGKKHRNRLRRRRRLSAGRKHWAILTGRRREPTNGR